MRQGKLGDIILDVVEREQPSHVSLITEKPVEKGVDITDHVQMRPDVLDISGVMTTNAAEKLETLRKYQREHVILEYVGRNIYQNLIIKNLNTDHAKEVSNGYLYTIQLQTIKIANLETFKIQVAKPETKKVNKKTATKVKKKVNKGRQQVDTKMLERQLTDKERLNKASILIRGARPIWEIEDVLGGIKK